MEVPFLDLKLQYQSIKQEIDEAIQSVVESGGFIMGSNVTGLEEEIEKYLAPDTNAVACASGSDALYMALRAINLQEGDEVITSPFTFFATAGSVVRAGGTPVFVDIESDTYNIDPSLIESRITKNTKAIIPVHIFGHAVDMDPIMELAEKYNLYVIEDACQVIGAEYKDRKLGTTGHFGTFSFFPTKNLGAYGDGGMVTAKDPDHYEYLKKLRLHGASKKYFHDFVGINSRLDALQAAILRVKLNYLDEWNNKRIEVAKKYNEGLENVVKIPTEKDYAKHIYHQYSIRADRRDELMVYLKEKEIAVGVYYPRALHLQQCFKDLGYKEGDLPVVEQVTKEILSLPVFPEMTDTQIDFVVKLIREFFS
jgi:dTDP-4-amino-4,6-dideoxygalactose transaminase